MMYTSDTLPKESLGSPLEAISTLDAHLDIFKTLDGHTYVHSSLEQPRALEGFQVTKKKSSNLTISINTNKIHI